MKTTYCSILAFVIFCGVLLCSCGDKQTAVKLYEQKALILQKFSKKSIIRRGDIFFQLSYHRGHAVNTFFFIQKSGEFELTHDTLQYPVKEIVFASSESPSTSDYRKTIIKDLKRLLDDMNRLGISSISAQFASVGVDMKIYFGDYKALLYVSDLSKVKNERWKAYIESGERFDANWYYVEDKR